jgi:hypothetical protein
VTFQTFVLLHGQFCFVQVGEGLCPRGGLTTAALHVKTSVLGDGGDVFVGGSFETRVWNGERFADVYYVSVFDG